MRQAATRKTKTIKIVMLGAASTGKTALVTRFAHNRFSSTESTIGVAFVSKNIKIDNKDVKLEIWDTGGTEKYKSLAPMYYRDTNAAIIVFDLTASQTLQDAQSWLNELKENGPPNALIAVAANKSDLTAQRQILQDEINDFSEHNKFEFIKETSALQGTNVNELFEDVTKKLLSAVDSDVVDDDSVQINVDPPQQQSKHCC